MGFQWLRRLRPKWTTGTFLLIVGWSSVVIWINIFPRPVDHKWPLYAVEYGFPFGLVARLDVVGHELGVIRFYPEWWRLPSDIAVGILVVALLTSISKYLLNRIVSVCKFGKVETE